MTNQHLDSLQCATSNSSEAQHQQQQQQQTRASVNLVRHHDGIIYNTGFHFNFNSSTASCSFRPNQSPLKRRELATDRRVYTPKVMMKRECLN